MICLVTLSFPENDSFALMHIPGYNWDRLRDDGYDLYQLCGGRESLAATLS
jgi:hypothetical protein